MINPWATARQSEQRAQAAEERAAFLEVQLRWMRELMERSREGEVTALKINCNVASARAFGFTPFPEAATVETERESAIREIDQDLGLNRSAVEKGIQDFKRREMERFAQMHQEDGEVEIVA